MPFLKELTSKIFALDNSNEVFFVLKGINLNIENIDIGLHDFNEKWIFLLGIIVIPRGTNFNFILYFFKKYLFKNKFIYLSLNLFR